MDHDQDQAGLTHLFWNADGDLRNVCFTLEKELQRMYPDSAKTMEISSRLENVQREFLLLLDECYYLVMEPSSPTQNEKPIKTITKGKPKEIEKERVSNKWEPNAVKKRAPGQFEVIRAPNQFKVVPTPDQCEMEVERSGVSLKFHEDVAKHEDDGGLQDYCDEYNRREGSDDFQDIDATKDDPIVSPKPATAKRKSKDNTNRKTGRKKLSTDASLKEDIHSLVQITSATSAAMPSCHSPCSGPTLEKCFRILQSLPGVVPQSNIWNYACNFLSKKEVRSMFLLQPDDEARLSWLELNYEHALKEKPYVIY